MQSKSILIILLAALMINNSIQAPVTVDIYTESLCPFCYKFLTNSFTNFFNNPSRDNLAVVNFYPYGNAQLKITGNSFTTTCQHGPQECLGNTILACGKYYFSRDYFYRQMICFSAQMYTYNEDFNRIAPACMSGTNLNQVLTCTNSQLGASLIYNLAQTKPSVINHTPYIVVNGIYDANVESQIFNNMNSYLCNLTGNRNLQGCQLLGY